MTEPDSSAEDTAAEEALAALVADDTGDTGDTGATGEEAPAPDDLGDAGKRAIDAMKRERNAARKELADAHKKIKEFTDKDKTETQRLQESAEEAKSRAATAESTFRKMKTALDCAPEGASLEHIRAVAKRLSGATEDELEADANELFRLFAPTKSEPAKKPLPGKPKENLRGGGDPEQEFEETNPAKLADLIGRRR